ncbi:pRL2-19 [Streptomyces sp. NPDC059816]|uniref:pRL2-19 n=1 Tax=Streptomyces sp. NPDC059816 TaxID=3346960 RepID=UPI00364C879B
MYVQPEDVSHALLIAVLNHHGGSLTIPAEALENNDGTATINGIPHVVPMEPLPDGTMSLVTVLKPTRP